jgi:hypothetical protein
LMQTAVAMVTRRKGIAVFFEHLF